MEAGEWGHMAEEWEPIRRAGHPDVKGVASEERRLLVHVPLSGKPPREWRDSFVGLYAAARDADHDRPLPEVSGAAIVIRPLDEELSDWIKIIDARIEEANAFYLASTIPEQQRKEASERAAEQQLRDRLDDARRKAEEL